MSPLSITSVFYSTEYLFHIINKKHQCCKTSAMTYSEY